ncbi:pyridoxamine 5'-phosphate oxidase family protein [Halorussus caseinilyticus]|uniref:Pyridoxamine 5'-phosphate oxidase family protein n=1 Tax=Halorussus caseinilyticus TaxID=3034025 RepID=A0ABD5WNW7_9EURY|nr:pyridoxamine 5'-phosphate oxidase family protein [Halorussus sp. DT72]
MDAALMCDDEVNSFLRDCNSGTLSLTDGRETYAFPESFGYDGDDLYFQFVHADASDKMSFVETTDVATFTTFTDDNPAFSVIARGRLVPVPDEETSRASSVFAENCDVPMLNVSVEKSVDELSFDFYRLRPDEISGRKFGDLVS